MNYLCIFWLRLLNVLDTFMLHGKGVLHYWRNIYIREGIFKKSEKLLKLCEGKYYLHIHVTHILLLNEVSFRKTLCDIVFTCIQMSEWSTSGPEAYLNLI